MNVQWRPSPNCWTGRGNNAIRAEVKHRIVGTLPSARTVFADTARQASTHFGIGYVDGVLTIDQYVDLSDSAWGNGDVREPTWTRIIPGLNPNLYTVSTEHEDGGQANGGVVSDEVWQASMELSKLLRCGNADKIRSAGIHVRDDASVAQLSAMPIDTGSYIDHNQIAGPAKPYCFRRWLNDPGFIEGGPSRRDRLLDYLQEDDSVLPADMIGKAEEWATVEPNTPFWTRGPGVGEQKFLVNPQAVDSIIEVGPDWRIVRLVPSRAYVFMRRKSLVPKVLGGDPKYDAGVFEVVQNGPQPAPVIDCSAEVAAAAAAAKQAGEVRVDRIKGELAASVQRIAGL